MASSIEDQLPFPASSVVFMRDNRDKQQKCIRTLRAKLGPVTSRWRGLGMQLRLLPETLDRMAANPGKEAVASKFQKMLTHWLEYGKEETRTWGFLADAVEDSNRALAMEIRRRDDFHESSTVHLGVRDLSDLLVQERPRWRKLAYDLYFPTWIVEEIEDPLTVEDCLQGVVKKWILNSENPTLKELIDALAGYNVEHRALADQIAKDVGVLKLLCVADSDKDKAKTEKELKEYIEKLEEKQKKLKDEIDGLPLPSRQLPKDAAKSTETVTTAERGK